MKHFTLLLFLFVGTHLFSQTDSTTTPQEEEDYSQYENATPTDGQNKIFCSPKIFDLSPARFVSIAWDHQLPYSMKLSQIGQFPSDTTNVIPNETANVNSTSGLRIFANIPVISSNKFLWQLGMNYWNVKYSFSDTKTPLPDSSVINNLQKNGLTTAGLHSTVFKPLNEKQFILLQVAADLSGNYTISAIQDLKFMRYSAAILWGKRPNDRKQWAIGLSRTYRAGESNIVPIILYNWTSPSRKWGTEILFPARAHVRKNFSARSLLMAGYELEGQSYRIGGISMPVDKELEIRRGELRFRLEFQRQIWGFIWGTIQAGYRYNYSFNADYTGKDGSDFFRGFVGTQKYAMINQLGGAAYFNIGIHLVSP
jgi:hypothetical protein